MVDLVVTAANVVVGADSTVRQNTAGAAIAAGQVVALDPTTQKIVLADNNSATVALRIPVGVALHAAALNQPVSYQSEGKITIGATLVAGTEYWLSDTPGGICPRADLAVGETATLIGIAETTAILRINLITSGVTL